MSKASGRSFIIQLTYDYTGSRSPGGTVTTGTYVQLSASWPYWTNKLVIRDTSGQAMAIAVGTAGNEVIQFQYLNGGMEIDIKIDKGQRVSIIALDASATIGDLNIEAFR